jgi:hypothetical protein
MLQQLKINFTLLYMLFNKTIMNLYLFNYNIHRKVPSDFSIIHIVKINATRHVVNNLNFSQNFVIKLIF